MAASQALQDGRPDLIGLTWPTVAFSMQWLDLTLLHYLPTATIYSRPTHEAHANDALVIYA